MKIVELINKLNEIGYDENTELTFSCVDGNTGEWYVLNINDYDGECPLGITYGEYLTGEEYHNDIIDIELDVDGCKDYINNKIENIKNDIAEDISRVINDYRY